MLEVGFKYCDGVGCYWYIPKVMEYIPKNPPIDYATIKAHYGDGSIPYRHEVKDAEDLIRIRLCGNSELRKFQAMFKRAAYYSESEWRVDTQNVINSPYRVWVAVRDPEVDDPFEMPGPTFLPGGGFVSMLRHGYVEVEPAGRFANLHIVRQPYWYRQAPSVVTLSNSMGSGSSVTVYNHDDADHDNYVDIMSTIKGDLPALTTVSVSGSMSWVGYGWRGNAVILEGENSLDPVTLVSDSNYSNGAHGQAQSYHWQISGVSGTYKTVVAGTLQEGDWRIRLSYGYAEQSTKWVNSDGRNGLYGLGDVKIKYGELSTIDVYLESVNCASVDSDIDYLILIPSKKYRTLHALVSGTAITDDEGGARITLSSGGYSYAVNTWGDHVRLWPSTYDQSQRLTFILGGTPYDPMLSATVSVLAQERWVGMPLGGEP